MKLVGLLHKGYFQKTKLKKNKKIAYTSQTVCALEWGPKIKIFCLVFIISDVCYLDHVGATLYSEEQIRQVLGELSCNIYGNPHSGNVVSKYTLDAIDQVRYQ